MSAAFINTLNVELNPICHLLALLEAHHFLHVSKIRVNHSVALYPIKLFSQGVFQYCALNFPYQITRPSKVSLSLCTI